MGVLARWHGGNTSGRPEPLAAPCGEGPALFRAPCQALRTGVALAPGGASWPTREADVDHPGRTSRSAARAGSGTSSWSDPGAPAVASSVATSVVLPEPSAAREQSPPA